MLKLATFLSLNSYSLLAFCISQRDFSYCFDFRLISLLSMLHIFVLMMRVLVDRLVLLSKKLLTFTLRTASGIFSQSPQTFVLNIGLSSHWTRFIPSSDWVISSVRLLFLMWKSSTGVKLSKTHRKGCGKTMRPRSLFLDFSFNNDYWSELFKASKSLSK